jgi:hypothetical protein
MKPATKCPTRPRFPVGARVRVRPGTIDPDYPVLPLGGWAGKVVCVAADGLAPYLLRWSRETLQKVHPVYRQLCAEDDRSFDEMWLDESDLECDAGGRLMIESPDRHRGTVRRLDRGIARRSRAPEPPVRQPYAVSSR